MSDEYGNTNPQITSVMIGTRELREVKIYPLSLADEVKFSDILATEFAKYLEASDKMSDEESGIAVAKSILKLVKSNIIKLLRLVTDEKIELEDLTNSQLTEIAEVIYDVNFGSISKNWKSLFEKVKAIFQPGRLTQLSANTIPDTDSNTSVNEVTEKEELPEDN